ncbi:MAG: hypothetical protein PUC77_02800 [Bacteroidales bacterium]|nr:hypothetical protein [Bacteroidales bacterium]
MTLIEKVTEDVQVFLGKQKNGPFMNERDLQMHLAIALKNSSNNYDKVEVEYYVPLMEAGKKIKVLGGDYVWNKDMRVDIVVEKDGKFIPIELKYKTKEIKKDIPRFDEVLNGVAIIKNQGAQNEAKYGFWKDVRRIELLKKRFKAVPGGLALFLTNDPSYQNKTDEEAMSYSHSIANGYCPEDKS